MVEISRSKWHSICTKESHPFLSCFWRSYTKTQLFLFSDGDCAKIASIQSSRPLSLISRNVMKREQKFWFGDTDHCLHALKRNLTINNTLALQFTHTLKKCNFLEIKGYYYVTCDQNDFSSHYFKAEKCCYQGNILLQEQHSLTPEKLSEKCIEILSYPRLGWKITQKTLPVCAVHSGYMR